MDYTLRYYLEDTNKCHRRMLNGNILLNPQEIKKMLNRIAFNIRKIQSVSHRMAYIYNVCQRRMSQTSYFINDSIKEINYETYPKSSDWKNLQKVPGKETKLAAPGININAVSVEDIKEIPDFPIFWIKNINQFAISINGTVIRGNIGNIYEKNTSKLIKNINNCKNNNCKMEKCNLYHDPIIYKTPSIKNFLNSSWLFTNSVKNMKNMNLRHIGSRDTLQNDLYIMKYDKNNKRELNMRFYQTMHDILILLCLDQYDLLDNNKLEIPS